MIPTTMILLTCLLLHLPALAVALSNEPRTYDLIVIGGGSAGLSAARFASSFDKSVAIVEKRRLGGDTTWGGVAPSKALLSCAKVAHNARRAAKFGVYTDTVRVDMRMVRKHLIEVSRKMYEAGNSRRVLSKRNIDSVIGEAAFVSNREIDVLSDDGQSSTRLRARKGIVIATGAGPRRLDGKIDGLDTVQYMTYEDIFRLNEVPKSLTHTPEKIHCN